MHFVYPRDLAEAKKVEEMFHDEAHLLKQNGHGVSLIFGRERNYA